ncbi:ankyrin repeat-containing domain protein [Ilyonectria sp. MPI-CAGE-AT-0026]|nr:ankyrin repeat-containing domain protein [Ilyonectria sp. MPI-CAGE-AT-0026]
MCFRHPTAQHVAAMVGHEAVVLVLLEKGADVATKDDDGWTVLHWAADSGHLVVVRVLLENGARRCDEGG